jgi:hypothetical protein
MLDKNPVKIPFLQFRQKSMLFAEVETFSRVLKFLQVCVIREKS